MVSSIDPDGKWYGIGLIVLSCVREREDGWVGCSGNGDLVAQLLAMHTASEEGGGPLRWSGLTDHTAEQLCSSTLGPSANGFDTEPLVQRRFVEHPAEHLLRCNGKTMLKQLGNICYRSTKNPDDGSGSEVPPLEEDFQEACKQDPDNTSGAESESEEPQADRTCVGSVNGANSKPHGEDTA